MPYRTTTELPPAVSKHLPPRARQIYREAFENAWAQYASPSARRLGGTREQAAHRVAWAAVKRGYAKGADGQWRRK